MLREMQAGLRTCCRCVKVAENGSILSLVSVELSVYEFDFKKYELNL